MKNFTKEWSSFKQNKSINQMLKIKYYDKNNKPKESIKCL